MRSSRLPGVLFVVLLLLGTVFIVWTSQHLPQHTASHFGGSGHADGFMSRNGYRLFMLTFGVALPLGIVAAIAGLPRLFPNLTNIPHRGYWLAPEHRAEAFALLDKFALWFGCAMVSFLCGVHWLVLQANMRQPPQLANGPFLSLLASFLLLLAVWAVLFIRAFRLPAG